MAEVANKRIFYPSSVMYCGFQILLNHLVVKFSIMDPVILSDFNKKKSQYMCNCVPKIAKYAHFCRRKHNKGRVRLTGSDEFSEKFRKGGGGHFQSKNLYCKILTFKQGFFSMKVIQKGLLGYVFTLLPC